MSAKQRELLSLLCFCGKFFYRQDIEKAKDNKPQIDRINMLNDMEQNLAYNISAQNFCDVVFLKLKRI